MAGGMMNPGGAAPGDETPGAGTRVPRGQALLSWRVALLPYLEENELYQQFHLDEPWDSQNNKPLLAKMPRIFAPPGGNRTAGLTYYQVFVGPHAIFEKHQVSPIFSVTDGTSNTILIAEAANPVPWTKPEDLHFAPDEPLPELGGLFPNVFNVAMADGSVQAISKKSDPRMLRLAIMKDDGNPIDMNRLRAPSSQRQQALKDQNDRLRQELDAQRQQLEAMRHEKELLQELVNDTETQALKKENSELTELIRRTRDETEQLRREIEKLKQAKQ
jgi:hypothetical protein